MSELLAELSRYLLEVTRLSGVLVVGTAPFEGAPRQAKVGLVLLLGLVAHGSGSGGLAPIHPLGIVPLLVSEFLIGVLMGLVVRMAVAVAEVAGTTLAPMIGFGAAQVFDPGTGQQDSVLTRVYRLFAGLVAVSVGLHRVLLAAVLEGFERLPVGAASHLEASAQGLLILSSGVISGGLLLALPALAALLMVQLALAFVARAAPAMQIFNIGFTIFLGTGGVLLWLTLPDTGRALARQFSHVGAQLEAVLLAVVQG